MYSNNVDIDHHVTPLSRATTQQYMGFLILFRFYQFDVTVVPVMVLCSVFWIIFTFTVNAMANEYAKLVHIETLSQKP